MKYDYDVFHKIWSASPAFINIQKIFTLNFKAENQTQNTITIVTNPFCGPCFKTHNQLEQYFNSVYKNLNIKIIFAVYPSIDSKSDRYMVAKRIVALYKYKGAETAHDALKDWFRDSGNFNRFKEWSDRHYIENEDVDDILLESERWCKENKIKKTPTIILNNKELPHFYDLSDIRYFVDL